MNRKEVEGVGEEVEGVGTMNDEEIKLERKLKPLTH